MTRMPPAADGGIATLLHSSAVRDRAHQLLKLARLNQSRHFTIDDAALPLVARRVADLTRQRYPTLDIPFHSRWRHFEAAGIDRKATLDALLAQGDKAEVARTQIDLAVVSVLLDAGAGPDWKYVEAGQGTALSRSEGLGVASFHAFLSGCFSSKGIQSPLRADAAGFQALQESTLANAFQVSESNPLVGLDSRAALLRRLGQVLAERTDVFGPEGRPGGLYDHLIRANPTGPLKATDILDALLETLSPIWPSGQSIDGVAVGDCWQHAQVTGPGRSAGWIPFHKLSQWMTYSLLEPFAWAGKSAEGLDDLTGLPEYRNGGLFLDGGVILPRDEAAWTQAWEVGDEFIVEWRALTVALLDELAPLVKTALGLAPDKPLPLACVLEGGTWATGRLYAAERRQGLPPFQIASDGTVF